MAESRSREEIQAWLVAHIADELGISAGEISPQSAFDDLGLASRDAVTLSGDLETWLGRKLSPTVVWEYPTIALLAEHLSGEKAQSTSTEAAPPSISSHEPIAIVGMGLRFPGASSPDEFWTLLREGRDAVSDVPSDRWNSDELFDATPGAPGKMYTKRGGFLNRVDGFDADFFGISPREASRMDPQQRLLMQTAWEALEDAGIAPDSLGGSATGVFVGISSNDYSQLQFADATQVDAYAGTGNAHSLAPNRISYFLDLRGPSIAVDTACSSSLVAVHQAVASLRKGECALALAGGVNVVISPEVNMVFSHARMMAPDGKCKTFDASADGYVRGEGAGVVVLKPLSRAVADEDDIYAVIRGSAVNHDGRSNGLTAPNGLAQQDVIRHALADAGVGANEVGYVEAHGTGTSLGDPIEVDSLKAVLLPGRATNEACMLGSVKTNIGHLEAAAGIAGLIKTALMLKNETIPAHLHLKQINPLIEINNTPMRIVTENETWPRRAQKRIAGVSSFGFGGANAHVIVEEAPVVPSPVQGEFERPLHFLTLSAQTKFALQTLASRYADALDKISLADACYTANTGRAHLQERASVVASDGNEAAAALRELAEGKSPKQIVVGNVRRGGATPISFLFTGQGAQFPRMGCGLYETSPIFRKVLNECDEVLRQRLPVSLLNVIYPDEGDATLLDETTYTQPALFAIEYALAELWKSWGIEPAYVMGHSVGEYVAACVAGVFSFENGLKLIAERARLMGALSAGGAMAAVLTDRDTVAPALVGLEDKVAIAAYNGPANTVVSGESTSIDSLIANFKARGIKSIKLNVSHAFHSPLMDPMLDEFERFAGGITFKPARIPLVSNLLGRVPDADHKFDAHYWRQHLRNAVQFLDGIKAMSALGQITFLEIGPQATLSGMGARCIDEAQWLPSLAKGQDDWQIMLRSLQNLYAQGAAIDWKSFDKPYTRRRAKLPTYPFEEKRYWLDDAASPRPIKATTNSRPPTTNTASTNKNDVSKCIYELRWVAKERNSTTVNAAKSWMILADSHGIGDALAQRIRARGDHAIIVRIGAASLQLATDELSIDPSDAAQITKLWAQHGHNIDRVVHLWSLDAPNLDDATIVALHRAHTIGCGAVLRLVQTIDNANAREASGGDAPLSRLLWCITQSAQRVSIADDSVSAPQAPVWGFGRSAAIEHAHLWGGLVDLASATADEIDALLAEIDSPDNENQIALRGGTRFVARLAHGLKSTKNGNSNGAHASCRDDATYIVTGGLGGLGLEVARWLGDRGAKHVVLFGRTSLPARDRWNSVSDSAIRDRIDAVTELESRGVDVRSESVDITDDAQLSAFLDAHQHNGRPPVRGIVHAAGVLDDHAIAHLSIESLTKVMRPKVDGSLLLHQHFNANGNGASNGLDFFVMFSSVASLIGSPGQANYAAANAFMDALAHHRHSHGQPALCINWGPWAEVGMAAGSDIARRLASQGISGITPSEGLAALDTLVSSDVSQVGVLQADWERLGTRSPQMAESPLLSDLMNGHAKPKSAPSPTSANDAEALEAYLRRQAAQILFKDEESIAIDRNFTELGLDSIMLMELVNSIERDLNVRLFPKELFDRPTIAALAPYLVSEINKHEHPTESTSAPAAVRSTTARLRPRLRRIGPAVRNKSAVFLLAAPRSGSTLLRVMLAGHPQLFSPPELHLLQYNTMREWREGIGTSFLGEGVPRAWMELRGYSPEEAKALIDKYVADDTPVEKVYAEFQEACAPRLLIDKSPSYGEGLDILEHAERIFENAKYVHLIRHPYSVIESFMRNRFDRLMMDGDADPMAAGEDVWATHNANISDFLASIDSRRKHVVKYEDIVAQPEAATKSLCEFLGVPYDEAVIKPYEGERMTDGVHKASAPIGDPNFSKHNDIDPSLGDVWKRTRLPRKLGGFARRVAAEFEYPLPVEVPGSGNVDVGISSTVPHVVGIQPKGTRPPFFCCAPAGGMTFMYFHLSRHLGENQPVFGVQDPALNPLIDPLPTMELLCAEQVKGIRKIQPKGPYYLGGWSFGGAVAFETAQQLMAAGEQVAFLGIIDTEARIEKHRARTFSEWMKFAWGQMKMSVKVVKHWPPYARDFIYIILPSALKKKDKADEPTLWEYISFTFADMIRHTLVKKADMAQVVTRNNRVLLVKQPQTRRTMRVLKANLKALLNYKLQPYHGNITLLRAEDQSIMHKLHEDWTLGWGELASGGIDIVEVPGNHAVLMNPPYIERVSEVIREGIDKAIEKYGVPPEAE